MSYKRLSSALSEIKDRYTVVIIGSGYGGATAASRLARAGRQVCVLERGREFQPGEYPDTEAEALAEVQAQLPGGHVGSRAGLYDFHVNPDVNVFVGCGLGGTSLINANVAVRPEARVFDDPRWPQALRDDAAGVQEGYRLAEEMLRPQPYPERYPALAKLAALEESAEHLGYVCGRPAITVNFETGVNHVGVEQSACMLCGDCITGCNYGAKNTVLFNYLPDARNFGAEIYTGVSVRHVERAGNSWRVHYQMLETGLEDFDAPTRTVSADLVILAAGTLGSTEILLRSRARGLAVSDQAGRSFSGNGDVLGFSYNCPEEIRGVGYGHRDPRDMEPVGPAVAGAIDMRQQRVLNDGVVIHELAAPGALSGLLPVALASAASALGRNTAQQAMETEESEIESLFMGPYESLASETQAYLVTTHEGGAGTMRLDDDRLRIEWPHVGEQPVFEKVNRMLAEATRALGGQYLINPVWSGVFNRDLMTLHPLGGCTMADDAADGVVNHKGQVFSGTGGTAVYDGLYVCDGSTIPRSLGAGPMLTITALSERMCALMARDRGWMIDYALPSQASWKSEDRPLGVRVSETWRGDSVVLELTAAGDDSGRPLRVAGRCVTGEQTIKVSGEFDLRTKTYRLNIGKGSREGASLRLEGALNATLHMTPQDLRRHLSTLRTPDLVTTERIGHALVGDLYGVYGAVSAGRKKRPLRVNAPTIYAIGGGGRMIRFEGGSHGPVLLSGLPSEIFYLDTIETNLVEYLFARSYDVWLADGDSSAAEAKIRGVTQAARMVVLKDGWAADGSVELNAATRDAVPEDWHGIAIIGKDAARDVYPRILQRLKS